MKKLGIFCLILALITVLSVFASCGTTNVTNPPEGGSTGTTTTASSGEQTESATPADSASYYVFEKESYEGTDYYVLKSVTEEGKKQKKLEVPKIYEGLEVQIVDDEAFAGCTELETVIFHSTVLELYRNLFPDSTKLTKIYLDFADLYKKNQADDSYIANNTDVALASDGSVEGKNSFIQGLDISKVKLVFTDEATYEFYKVEYRWEVFGGVMTLEK